MVEPSRVRSSRLHIDEAGTTLAELLVVVALFTVVGLVTTTGIVRGFNAQLDATNVAETLDGMRLATQRVRDFVREADEVCSSSTQTQLVLWTDDNEDGAVQQAEKDIFELDTTVDPPVFQRRVPAVGETQIIRDDILNGAIFIYDGDTARLAVDQPASLQCTDGTPVTDAVSRVRSVQVSFTVDHPDPDRPDLSTSTSVRIRNADLAEKPNDAPVASFTWDCEPTSTACTFDATGSTDPNGTVDQHLWDFGDGDSDSGVVTSHTYATTGTYPVTLLVVDNEGAIDEITEMVETGVGSGNPPPTADFELTTCTGGLICTFKATASDDSGIERYEWSWGDTQSDTTTADETSHTYGAAGQYTVQLRVVANDGDDLTITKTINVGSNVIRVGAINSSILNKTNNYDVTFTIQLERTTGGAPGEGITISVKLSEGKIGNDSCSTDSSGACSIGVQNIPNQKFQVLTVTNVTDTTSTYVYDQNQNIVTSLQVDKNNNKTYA